MSLFSVLIFASYPEDYQRFLECSGREEVFKYDLDDFYHLQSIGPVTKMEPFSSSRYSFKAYAIKAHFVPLLSLG